jgi:hypothetical protein
MEESGKEISAVGRDNRAVADGIYVYLLLEWMVRIFFTILIGQGAISSALAGEILLLRPELHLGG